MSKNNGTPTMKDVAREAGVALGTVSKVINGIPVGADYKNRVDKAVEKLHYQVNGFAKSLKISKTLTIALVIPNIYNTFFSNIAECLNLELAGRGYQMLLCTTDRGGEQSLMSVLNKNRVDGIVVLSYSTKLHFPEDLPVISIDRRFAPDMPCICSDNYTGGQLAAEKLSALGARKLAFLGTITDVKTEVTKRRDGFALYCSQHDIPFEESIHWGTDDFTLLEKFIDSHIHAGKLDFDGIFAVSDSCAYRLINYLAKKKIRVPEQVQVIGYDGIRKFGFLDYFCSTIVQPVDEIAKTCADLLLRGDLKSAPSLICLPVHYEAGGTTREKV